MTPTSSGLNKRLGRACTSLYARRSLSGHVPSVPLWVSGAVPSALKRAFTWRVELAEAEVVAAIEKSHWLRPAIDRTTDWSISPITLLFLGRLLEARRPTRIVEFGGGVSTLAFAAHARREAEVGRTTSVVSLEHDEGWLEKTRVMLKEVGLAEHVEFVFAPLSETTVYGRRQMAYTPPPHFHSDMADYPNVDFALIDGPPGSIGRLGSLAVVEPHLARGATILLDDAFRPNERSAWETWHREAAGRMQHSRIYLTGRGLAAAIWIPHRD